MKRIIALILVLATAFLTLTGCAFRYDKKNMSKYADFDAEAFRAALQELTISLGSFSNDPETRETLTKDEIAKALPEPMIREPLTETSRMAYPLIPLSSVFTTPYTSLTTRRIARVTSSMLISLMKLSLPTFSLVSALSPALMQSLQSILRVRT